MNNIKKIRNLKGLKLKDLSKKANVSTSYICELENDSENIKNPTKQMMERIAEALGSTVPEVFYLKQFGGGELEGVYL